MSESPNEMHTPESRSLLEPRRIGALLLIVVVLIATIALGLPRVTSSDEPGGQLDTERRQEIDPPKELTNFTLTNQDGGQTTLDDLQGKPVLMFFGFTHCPDVCPATMAEFRIIKRELGELGDDVNFMLVSVDGSRDTPESLKAYVEQFDPEFIGLTGDEDYVREIGLDYFLYFNRVSPEGTPSAAGSAIDHTAYSYLIDPDGRLRVIYPFQAPRDTIIQDLRDMLNSSGQAQ